MGGTTAPERGRTTFLFPLLVAAGLTALTAIGAARAEPAPGAVAG